jgi:hypothetical protein
MSVQEIIQEAKALSAEEREQLIQALANMQSLLPQPTANKKRSLIELAGLGKEIWEGVDAQEYINQLRSEWDHRP